MSINIRELADRGILEVTYLPDDVTKEDLAEQRRLVADAILRSSLRKVLMDASALKSLPSAATIFYHNRDVSDDSTFNGIKFAVVFESVGKDERFIETSGMNRNIPIKCFTSKKDALSWLSG